MKKWLIVLMGGAVVALVTISQKPARTVAPNPWGPGAESPFQTSPNGNRPAPDCHTANPSCPTSLGSESLAAVLDLPTFTVNPPSPGSPPPVIDAAEAQDIAWQEGGGTGDSQKALLGTLPAGGDTTCGDPPVDCGGAVTSDALVWVVQYYNGCMVASATLSHADQPGTQFCGITTSVLIDANTGDFISAFEV